MKLSYKRTFSQFVENYIASYYSAGIRIFQRLAGGPILIFFGILILTSTHRIQIGFFRVLAWLIGFVIVLYGTFYFLRPAIQLFLVWLRRDQFLGEEGEEIILELDSDQQLITINDPEGQSQLPLTDIRSIQHRADSTWILTTQDQMIYVPRKDLTSGDHDSFIQTITDILDKNEQKY
jgi:hypothetical protein